MAEQEERTYIPYTYTYDQFTAFFIVTAFISVRRTMQSGSAAWTL